MSALGHKRTFRAAIVMSALPLKATEIADIVGPDEGQSTSALPRTFKRLPAPLWRGHRPHQCRDTGQCSLSWCDLAEAGRPADFRCGGR
jgi:hypothetical protein